MNLEKVFELYLQTLRGPLKVNLGAEIFQNWQFELRPSFPWTEQVHFFFLHIFHGAPIGSYLSGLGSCAGFTLVGRGWHWKAARAPLWPSHVQKFIN